MNRIRNRRLPDIYFSGQKPGMPQGVRYQRTVQQHPTVLARLPNPHDLAQKDLRKDPDAVNSDFSNFPFQALPGESRVALSENTNRRYLLIQNLGAFRVYVAFGQPADEGAVAVDPSGGFYELNIWVPRNAINIRADGAAPPSGVFVTLVEG